MATAIKVCRVCGKEYEACHSARTVQGVYRWQEVACSPECGAKYLADVLASRVEGTASPMVKPHDIYIEPEYDDTIEDLEYEDFDIDYE